jgi:cell division protein FtsW (lipid II flippase)
MNDFLFELIMMEEGLIYVLFLWFFFLYFFFMNVVKYDVEDDEEIEGRR